MNIEQFLSWSWTEYLKNTPSAKKIKDLLEGQGEVIQNDHIALRTFDHPIVNIDRLASYFLSQGYREGGDYHFEEKKLYAKHYEHPDKNYPKIFISQLLREKLSPQLKNSIDSLIDHIDPALCMLDLYTKQRPWPISFKLYQEMSKESDYAAWLGAIGFRANHFTVLVNKLKKYDSIEKINQFLKLNGFSLNSSGGEIKGGPEVLLAQSSIMADKVGISFSDGEYQIPTCYYEFARRYRQKNGEFYQGFVAQSADKIFESTDN